MMAAMKRPLLAAAISACLCVAPVAADAGYDKPPANVLEVMRAPPPPVPMASPTHDKLLLVTWQEYPSIARVATPYLRLAGARVEPANHSKHDTPGGYGITPCAQAFDIVDVADGKSVRVALPEGACPNHPAWSADGRRFAFENITPSSVELWVGDASTGAITRVPGVRVNPMLDFEVQWMPDQRTLLVKTVAELGPAPARPAVPPGPSIQESTGQKGQSSTYEARDTLASPHDEDLFEYYAASQLVLVDAASGAVTPLGKAGIYYVAAPAPDGRHLLVATIHKPYSYVTTFDRFPVDIDIWDVLARPVKAVHRVTSRPLADRVPIRGVVTGPRAFSWRATEPATLVWAEALDRGDWSVKVPHRDRVMLLKAPFEAPPVEIARSEQRYSGLTWSERPGVALRWEYDENRHWVRSFIVDVDDPKKAPRLLWDRSSDERYANPGSPVRRQLPNGMWVMRQEGDSIFLQGAGASPEGDRPFLDRLDLVTLESDRLFRSDRDAYESFLAFAPGGSRSFVTWHQSEIDPPNAFLRTLAGRVDAAWGEAAVASKAVAITHLPDPTPAVRQIRKRLVKYKRADGLDLSFTLYTPPGYKEGTRVPAILYAYPLDYAEASAAGQVSGSEHTFTRLRLHRLLLLSGYALIDMAAFPIVGDPRKAYDTYLEQLVADAKAAVDEAVALGVVDAQRIGVTGHSHGALMTVNLLAHSDLFRAGVATSGSYNKTLTPFGFQNERRSVWEAQDVYLKASPFFYADKLKAPLLIVHGADDANPGTTPLQATKLYEAVRGNGGMTRLVMLPNEPHWYTARESSEQLAYEMLQWFDKYVKGAPAR